MSHEDLFIAVLIPCYNEEMTVKTVVNDFRKVLPSADIYVYDNASSDRTNEFAKQTDAIVRYEPLKGKGNVVHRMFADIEADLYIMVDGDATYDAASAPKLVDHLLDNNYDMVNGARVEQDVEGGKAYRLGHKFGNQMFTNLVGSVFGKQFDDILSGYRVFSRRFVKSFPALSSGFEIETELTIHALELRLPVGELNTPYYDRPDGSESKLNTISDGIKIMKIIIKLIKEERPFQFFGIIGLILALLSLVLGYPLIPEFLETGLVPRIPTAILASVIMLLSFLSITCGLILETVTLGRKEIKRLHYLNIRDPRNRRKE